MAILSDYAIGTVSIAANASVVTGTGTAWNIQSFQEGDLLFVDGDVVILSGPPTSATSLPITRPWLGGAKTNVPYRLRYMSDGSRYTNRAQELINLLGDGTLTALATVGSAINKLSYWSAAGVAALTDLSPFARTNIINATSRTALLASGTGIGVSISVGPIPVVSTDLNNDLVAGWVNAASGTTANLPTGAGTWIINVEPWNNGTHILQTAHQAFGGGVNPRRQYTRERSNAGVWSSWIEQGINPTLGTVSQSGGVPTGSVIERGSNANGEYVRFADGTMICWAWQSSVLTTSTATGSVFVSALQAMSFPANFIAVPAATATYQWGGSGTYGWASLSGVATNFCQPRAWGYANNATAIIGYQAIGRWF